MTEVAMDITSDNKSMRLYSPPTFEQWFDNHNYDYRRKNRTLRDRPTAELTSAYQKAVARHLKWQGTLIKVFMQNCNGHKVKPCKSS